MLLRSIDICLQSTHHTVPKINIGNMRERFKFCSRLVLMASPLALLLYKRSQFSAQARPLLHFQHTVVMRQFLIQ
jgi:hypothetical protein